MKKLILFLLPLFALAQNPTNFPYGIKNTAGTTNSTPTYFVTQETDGIHKKTPAALIATKSDLPATYATIVYVNATSPNTATIFDDENPPITNDNALKLNIDNLYIGNDASTWVYNGITYVTKVVPATSNFYIDGTSIDAGNNKTSTLYRSGGFITGGQLTSYSSMVSRLGASDTVLAGSNFRLFNNAGSEGNIFQLNASNGVDLWNYASGTWNKRFTFSSVGGLTANSFVKSGGTSSQFLKADGSVDGNSYALSSGSANYIQNQNVSVQSADMWISGKLRSTAGTIISKSDNSYMWDNYVANDGSNRLYSSALTQDVFILEAAGAATFSSTISATSYTGSATLTGTPTAPTATAGTNTTQIATTAFVQANTLPLIGHLQYDNTDKTIWNNGKNNVTTNSSFGQLAFNSNVTGTNNSVYGYSALSFNTDGSSNVAIGRYAGTYSSSVGGFQNQHSTNSVFLGENTVAKDNNAGNTNEIVIGSSAIGNGSNSVTIGNNSIIKTVLRGVIRHSTSYTVSTLPAGTQGDTAFVTDATAPTYLGTLTGGGSVVCPVFYNGTAWVSH